MNNKILAEIYSEQSYLICMSVVEFKKLFINTESAISHPTLDIDVVIEKRQQPEDEEEHIKKENPFISLFPISTMPYFHIHTLLPRIAC